MQPISMMRSPRPAFRPVVSVSSTTRRIARRLSGARRGVKSAAALPIAVDVRPDDRVRGRADRAARPVHEPQPDQADEKAAGRERRRGRREPAAELSGASGPLVDARELAGELVAAVALAV